MHALYALDGMPAAMVGTTRLREENLLRALDDQHPQVRRHAVDLCSRRLSDKIIARLSALSDDPDMEVRYAVAFQLGGVFEQGRYVIVSPKDRAAHNENTSRNDSQATIALERIIARDPGDRWIQLAVQSSLGLGASQVLRSILADESLRKRRDLIPFVEKLAAQTSLQSQLQASSVENVLKVVDQFSESDSAIALAVTRGLTQGLKVPKSEVSRLAKEGKLTKMQTIVDTMLAKSTATAVDEKAAVKTRLAAIDTLGMGKFADLQPTLKKLIDNRQPTEVQLAALATLGKFPDAGTADVVLAAWSGLSPQVREPALEVLFARPERIVKLLDAVESKKFAPGDIPPARVQALTRGGAGAATKERVAKLLGSQMLGRRADVIAAYREALTIKGNVETGRLHFKKNCSSCHKAEGFGHEIGPNLASIKTRGPDAILTNVLDPSREVNPQFVNYTAVTDDGRTITGLIGAESATAVTLKRAEGQQDTILRVNLEELASTGLSLMPEGMEKQLDKQALADVIAYLMQLQ